MRIVGALVSSLESSHASEKLKSVTYNPRYKNLKVMIWF